ncbi:MAG: response regulator [SAR324 cluster bacterium]|nr:response regulator [SAR324 cluster bacterium]
MEKKPTVLVVDDAQENIFMVTAILQSQHNVISETNGAAAIRVASDNSPDLILLDIKMPEMDGFETCGRLKLLEETQDIPIIFVTANTTADNIVKGFELGAVDYVTKPFNKRELVVRVNTHLKIASLQNTLLEQNQNLEQRVIEKTEAALSIEKTLRREVDESFLMSLDSVSKSWFIDAASQMLLVDGYLDEFEIAYLRTIVTFIGDDTETQRLLNAIKSREPQKLVRISLDKEVALEIMTILLKIAIVDGNLSIKEANIFIKIGGLIGMDIQLLKEMLEWSRSLLATNKKYKKIEQEFFSTDQNFQKGPQNEIEAKKLSQLS